MSFVKTLRSMAQRLRASAEVEDAERVARGIKVPDTTPTPVGTPPTRLVVTVDTSQRLSHVIAFADEVTPTHKAKPSGVMEVELWVKIGDPPPVDPDELKFLGLDTRTRYTATYGGTDGGQIAHYMLRWLNIRGEKSP